ncbi:MAG TPA: type II toxin-antitoxin system HicA family toxin [Fimbriimonas sp.]|nr:type II toxin-antitoxin system HicA family toxin [Fimbriimonas sp.]
MGHIRRLKAKEIEAILGRYGYELVSQRGSHRKWRNGESRLIVIVPDHGGREVPLGTLRQIMLSANIPDVEWRTD